MKTGRICRYCRMPLLRPAQVKYCSLKCFGLARRQGEVTYTFSSDGGTGYGLLRTGETFLFDAEDFPKIKDIVWYRALHGAHGGIYVVDCRYRRLHRFILDVQTDYEVDHINLDTLDNRKSNLRLCTHRQNQCNQPAQSNNTSGVSGVSWKKNRNTWNARIKHFGQEIHLGAYHSFTEAVQARNEGMKLLFGEYGRYSNVPEAPPWIKKYVLKKCSRFVDDSGAAVSICR